MQRISLGALIIALALMVDDAMTTTDAMLTRLAQGDDKVEAATFAFRTYAFAMLAGTLVTIGRLRPRRLRSQRCWENILHTLCRRHDRVDRVFRVRRRSLRAAAWGRDFHSAKGCKIVGAGLGISDLPGVSHRGAAGKMADNRDNARDVCRVHIRDAAYS